MPRMLVIVNPYATGVRPAVRDRVLAALAERYTLEDRATEAPGHAVALASEAAEEGFDVVAALGGDGTVNEVANGLRAASANGNGAAGATAGRRAVASRGTGAGGGAAHGPALACLPGGQASIYARMLGMPADLRAAAARLGGLAEGLPRRRVDLGVVNGRCFTFASGLGIDASVTRRVDSRPRLKARFGPWYYAWSLGSVLARRYLARAPRMAVRVSGEETGTGINEDGAAAASATAIEGLTTIVQNGSPYTYFKSRPIDLAEGGALDSGHLAGCVLERSLPVDLPTLAWRALSARASVTGHRRVAGFTAARSLIVSSPDGRPLPLHVDGDYIGDVTEARYSVLPGALDVLA
jgi:diacylglycerol kinase family enzyme